MEQKMRENNVEVRKDIEKFMTTTKEVLQSISRFKIEIKQLEAEQKLMKKEQERQAIIEEERERIAQEEKNRIIAQYHEEQAELARKNGDMKAAEEHASKATKFLEKQKEQERVLSTTTDSSDSSPHESEEEAEQEDEDDGSESSKKSSSSKATSSSAGKVSKETKESKDAKEHAKVEQDDEQLDIKRVIDIINATNKAGFLMVKHGKNEFKITELTLDRVNSKLILNVEPINQEKQMKVNFE